MDRGYFEELHERAQIGDLQRAVDRIEQQLKEMERRLDRDRAQARDAARDIGALRQEMGFLKKLTGLDEDRDVQWMEDFIWGHRK